MIPVTKKFFKKEEHRGQKNLINWNWRHFHGELLLELRRIMSLEKNIFYSESKQNLRIAYWKIKIIYLVKIE